MATKKKNTPAPDASAATAPTSDVPKKERKKLGKLGTMIASLEKVVKSSASIDKRISANLKAADRQIKKLSAWGIKTIVRVGADGAAEEVEVAHASDADLLSKAQELKTSGFVPPAVSTAAEGYAEGDPIEVKPDFQEAYRKIYSEDDLSGMTFGFFDDINKVAMCNTTTGRVINAKRKHLQPRTVAA